MGSEPAVLTPLPWNPSRSVASVASVASSKNADFADIYGTSAPARSPNRALLAIDQAKPQLFNSEKQKLNFLAEIPILNEIPVSSDAGVPLTSKKNSCINEIFKRIAEKLVKSISDNTNSEIKINN